MVSNLGKYSKEARAFLFFIFILFLKSGRSRTDFDTISACWLTYLQASQTSVYISMVALTPDFQLIF